MQHGWISKICQVKDIKHKKLHVVWFHICEIPEKVKLQPEKVDQWLLRPGAEGEDTVQSRMKKLFRVMEMFSILSVVVVIHLYTVTKIH